MDLFSSVDMGVLETKENQNDIGKFKVPYLANIGTKPSSMHDGRFEIVQEIMEHYSANIQNHANLRSPFASTV